MENPKKSTSKPYDAIREKVPKSLSDSVYCSVFWYVLQDLCARIQEKDAAWLSNAGDLSAVRLEPQVCIELLLQVLPSSKDVLLNRVEYSSLIDVLVWNVLECSLACACFCQSDEGGEGFCGDDVDFL